MIFPVFTLCLAVSSSGIQTAISRFVAAEVNGKRYLYCGLFLSISISALFSIGIYYLAPWIASDILKESRTTELLQVMCLSLVPASIHSCFNGYYYGKENSSIPSACQIIEQLTRVCGTYLIYQVLLEQGLPLKPIHAVWGLVISEVSGLLVNITSYLIKRKSSDKALEKHYSKNPSDFIPHLKTKTSTYSDKNTLSTTPSVIFYTTTKALLLMAIPLTTNHVLMTLSHSLENLLLPQKLMEFGYTSDEALGHFGILTGMALSVIFFPSAITNSLSVLLLPRISEAKAKGDMQTVLDTIKGTVCCGVVLGSLCTFVFLLSADWIGTYIFDSTLAGFYIRILSILCPFMYTSGLLCSIVNGLGNASLTLICNLSGCVVRILAIFFLVPVYGMYAYIISMIVASVLVMAELIIVIRKVIIFP